MILDSELNVSVYTVSVIAVSEEEMSNVSVML
jgi:hypothetical protein